MIFRSERAEYGDKAIGFVELYRKPGIKGGTVCTVRCKCCPEHNTKSKMYVVEAKIGELPDDEEIISIQCKDCAASAGKQFWSLELGQII